MLTISIGIGKERTIGNFSSNRNNVRLFQVFMSNRSINVQRHISLLHYLRVAFHAERNLHKSPLGH
jgi:hypothetical protein